MTQGNPVDMEASMSRVVAAVQSGDWNTAETLCTNILEQDPLNADALYLLGWIFQSTGRSQLAIPVYRKIQSSSRSRADALNNLGIIHEESGNMTTALSQYRMAAESNPSHTVAAYNAGRLTRMTGNPAGAIGYLESALAADTGSPPVLTEIALACKQAGRLTDALEHINRLLQTNDRDHHAHNIAGNIYQLMGKFRDAIASYESALQIKPCFPEARNNMGSTFIAMGDVPRGLAAYRESQAAHDGSAGISSNYLLCSNYTVNSQEELYELHLTWGAARGHARHTNKPRHEIATDGKIHIAYISPDLRAHSVTWFLEAILENHDRDHFHVTCLSDTTSPDSVTGIVRSLADNWENIAGMSDEAVCDRVRQCNIDILVDLAGHTANNRLNVFSMAPAPVLVSYLGYPNTTGLGSIQYRITDSRADPVGDADRLHTEKLVRLPGCFLCYSPTTEAPATTEPPYETNGHITYCSFNVLAKVSDDCIDAWADILDRVSGSRLLLKSAGLEDPDTQALILERFRIRRVDPDRIELVARTNSMSSHLLQYNRADIALDTFPYNGTTTTCEALWMGVPVITLSGNRHAGRVGNSILHATGLEKLVAGSTRDYVSLATGLAGNVDALKAYRTDLRSRVGTSPLCDGKTFTTSLERAYRDMIREYRSAHPSA